MATTNTNNEYEQDFTPKTANRKISKPLLILAAVVIVLAGLGIGGYFVYQGLYYYKTDNAKVDTTIYQLTPTGSGKLEDVYVVQNEGVIAGQVLARMANGTEIKSPADGTVTDVNMQIGDYATPTNVIMVVAETSDISITANVEETDILKIHKGQSATVSLDAYGRSFNGVVDEVDTITSTKLSGGATSFTTSGTYTKVTQLIPVKIRLLEPVDLAGVIGTNATVVIRIK
jgi:multidrug resistance efflux pump